MQAQVQREHELREKEQRLMQERKRIQKEKQLYEEQQRRLKEEAERQARDRGARERKRKLEVEREREHERRLREEKERERQERESAGEEGIKLERAAKLECKQEQKLKQEELKWEQRDCDHQMIQQQQQQQRLGKRGNYRDSDGFDVAKRQAVHDIRGSGIRSNNVCTSGMDMYELLSSVFSRLDAQKQAAEEECVGQLTSGIQSMSSMIPSVVLACEGKVMVKIKLDDGRVWRRHVNQVIKSQVPVGADTSGRVIDPVPIECDPLVMPSDEEAGETPGTGHVSDTVEDIAEDSTQPQDGPEALRRSTRVRRPPDRHHRVL